MVAHDEPDIERLLAALAHKETDCVPNFETGIRERNTDAILGREQNKSSGELEPADLVELARRIGMDSIGCFFRWKLKWMEDEWAGGRAYYRDGLLKGWGDLEGIKAPDLTAFTHRLDDLLEATKSTRIGVHCIIGGPFSTAYISVGMADFMLKLYDDPAFIERVLDLTTEHCVHFVEEVCKRDIWGVFIAEDMGSSAGLLMRPDQLQRLWKPHIAQVIEPMKARGVIPLLHSDGDIHEMIPTIVDVGFQGLQPLQPCGKLDIYEVKERWGDRLCLFGNIDVTTVLSFGAPDEVVTDVEAHIDRLSPGGGYVCGSSKYIANSVPPENFRVMIETIHTCGRYECRP